MSWSPRTDNEPWSEFMHSVVTATGTQLMQSSSDASPAGLLLGILLLAGLVVAKIAYGSFKKRGFRPREVTTTLTDGQLREIFERTVSGKGWSIVDAGNPMVAQSSLLAGIRQQIALHVHETNGRRVARIAVTRYSTKVFGGATKAYTLRWRMSAFLGEVQRADVSAAVAG
jgi:hypothetical protein